MALCKQAILGGRGHMRYWRKATSGLTSKTTSCSIWRRASSANKIRLRKWKLLGFSNPCLFRRDRGRVSPWTSLHIFRKWVTLRPSWLLLIDFRSTPLSFPLPNYVLPSWLHNYSLSISWSCGEFQRASWETEMIGSPIPSRLSYLLYWGEAWTYP